jgi:outer membrane lipoprotein SlyB
MLIEGARSPHQPEYRDLSGPSEAGISPSAKDDVTTKLNERHHMQNYIGNTPTRKTHPAIIAAGVAVVLFCVVGTAAIMGLIPGSGKDALPPAPIAAIPARSATVAAPAHQVQASRQSTHAVSVNAAANCSNCGKVESVRSVKTEGHGSGLGAAGGAVVGGLLGNQIGGGRGQDVMTVVGAIGGAVAGNQVEARVKSTQAYETAVRLNDGSLRTVQQSTQPQWQAGDRVRIVDGVIRTDA